MRVPFHKFMSFLNAAAAWLPHAQAVTLPALGHSLPEEDPQAVAAALLEFLR